jgi:hypothetical protein
LQTPLRPLNRQQAPCQITQAPDPDGFRVFPASETTPEKGRRRQTLAATGGKPVAAASQAPGN